MLSVYHEEGMVGVVIVVGILTALVGSTVFAPPGPRRAVALFLVTYCIVVVLHRDRRGGHVVVHPLPRRRRVPGVGPKSSRRTGPMKVKF